MPLPVQLRRRRCSGGDLRLDRRQRAGAGRNRRRSALFVTSSFAVGVVPPAIVSVFTLRVAAAVPSARSFHRAAVDCERGPALTFETSSRPPPALVIVRPVAVIGPLNVRIEAGFDTVTVVLSLRTSGAEIVWLPVTEFTFACPLVTSSVIARCRRACTSCRC